MPLKMNTNRPLRFRARYRIRNWPQYEAGLKRRGDLTLWLDEAAIAGWHASRRTTAGGQARYLDLASSSRVLTGKEAGDAGQVPVLLEQVGGEIASVMADGAYNGEPVYRAIAARHEQAAPSIVIPPRRSAVFSSQADTDPSQR